MKHDILISDIHMHVIPRVDDGALSLKMAMEMLESAGSQGVGKIICTSHSWEYAEVRDRYLERLSGLREEAESAGMGIKLYTGNEVLCVDWDMDGVLRKLDSGMLFPLNGTRYVLTELYPDERYPVAEAILNRLIRAGWTPVIAHAERCYELRMADFREFAGMGCLIQINAYNLGEEHIPMIRNSARRLLSEQLVSFIGSDAHRTDRRPPRYREGIEYIMQNCSPEYAERILYRNAEELLNL